MAELNEEDGTVQLNIDDPKYVRYMTEVYNRAEIEAADQAAYDSLKANGVQILELEDQAAWVEAMGPVYEKHGKDFLDLIAQIQGM